MDYAFAPGSTTQDARLRQMFARRDNTTLVSAAGASSIEDFLKYLKTSNLTAEDLVVGSHASDEGFLLIALDSAHTHLPVDYEDLEAVDTSGTIQVDPSIRAADSSFHFKGCTIGSDDGQPFLTLLKQALNIPNEVTAPKYFHGLYEFPGEGIFEFMGYNYFVIAKDPFPTRTALVKAFQDEGFTQLDGTAVSDADIDKWVSRRLTLRPRDRDKKPIRFPVKIVPSAAGRNAIDNPPAECRSRREQYTYSLDTHSAPPAGKPAQIAAMKTSLQQEDNQQDTHPYPIYQRLHYSSFDDFFDGQTWTVTIKGTAQNWVGTHFVYTLVIPILKPGTADELIFNFYPVTGAATMNFLEDNATYDLFGKI